MHRSPYALNVADLLGSDASGRSVTVAEMADWQLDLVKVSSEEPVVADIMLHPVSSGIAVTGTVAFTTEDVCQRCLATSTTARTATIGALFDRSDDDETYDLVGHEIDVEQMLRDEVLLSLPVVIVCEDGCEGVVDSAQNDLNTGASDDEDEPRSPFAVLKDLLGSED